jgi:molybdopterin-containing oxidoreductase family membrane subunit
MSSLRYQPIEGKTNGFWALLGALGAAVLIGLFAAHHMETEGHWVTGMNNHIVWGTPHVFAVFLIVAASGALNVASIASVFGRTPYKPLSRLSAVLAMTLLIGGLAILVLDLGRPDRLLVAMTTYNFKSIFAWNIFLYNGFLLIVGVYLWFMMERRMNRFSSAVGFFAFIWRLILTTGTGSIFGFLVAREAYDSAIMAPMFVIMSFSYGLAIFILFTMAAYAWTGRPLGDALLMRLKNLLGIFVAAVLYFVLAFHITALYATEHHGVERFLLLDGGVYTQLFWGVQIFIGSLVPLALLYLPFTARSRAAIATAAVLVVVGGLGQMYATIIGGQAYPLEMFPGREVSSSFFDGSIVSYAPSLWEVLLGIGGTAIALIAAVIAVRVLPVLPTTLSDQSVTSPKEVKEAGGTATASA